MRLYWVESPAGRLATAPAPRADVLESQTAAVAAAGVGLVVSALPVDESARLGLEDQQALLAEHGIRFARLEVPDFGVPPDVDAAAALIDELASELRQDRSVVVHCRGGIGRCSTLAAATLTRLGVEAEAAMDAISQARGMRVPETMGQRMWVHSQAVAGDRS